MEAAKDAVRSDFQGTVAKTRSPGTAAVKTTRHIPADVKRAVFERDGQRCSYRDPQSGKRCVATHYLQIDHINPYALGVEHSVENCRVLCHHHNQHRVSPRVRFTAASEFSSGRAGVDKKSVHLEAGGHWGGGVGEPATRAAGGRR